MSERLQGARLMVVEDDELLGLLMVDVLTAEGVEVLGPFATALAASEAVREELTLDGAVLDVHLLDGTSYGLAAELQGTKVPFAFVSASNPNDVPPALHPLTFLHKPMRRADVVRLCEQLVAMGRH